jgi:hypothetical protein
MDMIQLQMPFKHLLPRKFMEYTPKVLEKLLIRHLSNASGYHMHTI